MKKQSNRKNNKQVFSSKENLLTSLFEKWLIWLLILLFGLLYSFIAVVKHLHFQTGLDLSIYVQSLWQYANLSLPYVTLYPTHGDLGWADHFTPSIAALTPVYALFPDAKTLLILQALLFCSGAYPIFIFAKKTLKSTLAALAFAWSYLMFFGTQFALTFDFHAATYSAIFFPWIIWFVLEKKWLPFFIFSLLAIGGKEDVAPIIATIGLIIILTKKNWKVGLITLLFSLIYFLLVVKIVMPSLYLQAAKVFNTPHLPTDPLAYLTMFFNSPIKIKTLLLSFGHFGFLPILSGYFLLLPFVHFFLNFPGGPEFSGRWDIYLHYRVQLASLMSFGAILGLKNLLFWIEKYTKKTKILYFFVTALLIISIALDVFLRLPLNTLGKRNFYEEEAWMKNLYDVMEKIPPGAYLLTQNNLFPHLANRKNIYEFPLHMEDAEYVFLDLRPNQPIINFWLSGDQSSILEMLKKSDNLKPVYRKGDAVLFEVVK